MLHELRVSSSLKNVDYLLNKKSGLYNKDTKRSHYKETLSMQRFLEVWRYLYLSFLPPLTTEVNIISAASFCLESTDLIV